MNTDFLAVYQCWRKGLPSMVVIAAGVDQASEMVIAEEANRGIKPGNRKLVCVYIGRADAQPRRCAQILT